MTATASCPSPPWERATPSHAETLSDSVMTCIWKCATSGTATTEAATLFISATASLINLQAEHNNKADLTATRGERNRNDSWAVKREKWRDRWVHWHPHRHLLWVRLWASICGSNVRYAPGQVQKIKRQRMEWNVETSLTRLVYRKRPTGTEDDRPERNKKWGRHILRTAVLSSLLAARHILSGQWPDIETTAGWWMASARAYGSDIVMNGRPHLTKNGKNFIRKSEISGEKSRYFFYGKSLLSF